VINKAGRCGRAGGRTALPDKKGSERRVRVGWKRKSTVDRLCRSHVSGGESEGR